MNIIAFLGIGILTFWIVYKLAPAKNQTDATTQDTGLTRPWYEILEISPLASENEIEARYNELSDIYSEEAIQSLDLELQDEARSFREEVNEAYRLSKFRLKR